MGRYSNFTNDLKNKNIKAYTSLKQIGISASTATVTQIAMAMPDNSIFFCTESLISDNDKPAIDWGNIEIIRMTSIRWSAKWYSQTASNDTYHEFAMAGTGTAATGWKTIYSAK